MKTRNGSYKKMSILTCVALCVVLLATFAMLFGGSVAPAAAVGDPIADLVTSTTMVPIVATNDFSNDPAVPAVPWVKDGTYNSGAVYKSDIAGMDNKTSAITFTFTTTTAGVFLFDYKTSTEQNWDYLSIKIGETAFNDTDKKTYSGKRDWSKAVVALPAGAQSIQVGYTKDPSGNGNTNDTVWIANAEFLSGNVDVVVESTNTALGTATGSLTGVAMGTKVTLTAAQTPDQAAVAKFMGWFNASDVKVSEELSFVFQATKTEKIVAKFLPYVVLDTTTLTYGATTKDLILGETLIDIDPKQIYDYTISIPTIAVGNNIKIVHNGKVVTLNAQGNYVFSCDEMPNNEIVITTTQTNCAEKVITLKTKATMEQMLGKAFHTSSVSNMSDRPWKMVAENGKMVFESGIEGYVGEGKTSILTLDFNVVEDKILSLRYFLGSYPGDVGSIILDGVALVDKISGAHNWTSLVAPITAGDHVLQFIYAKKEDWEQADPDMLRFCDLSVISKNELPNVSLSKQDGAAAPVVVGDVFLNGVYKKLPSAEHDYWTNSARKYLLNFGNLNAQYNYYVKVKGDRRIDVVNNQVIIENVYKDVTVDIYAEKDGRGHIFANYFIHFLYELKGIINTNDSDKTTVTVNDANNPWVLDQTKTTSHGKNVYKNTTQGMAGITSCFTFDITVPSDATYLLNLDYIVSTYGGPNHDQSGYEYMFICVDGKKVTNPNDQRTYDNVEPNWRSYSVKIAAGTHKIEIGISHSSSLSGPNIVNLSESTLWVSNIRLETYTYPDMYLTAQEGSAPPVDLAVICHNGEVPKIDKINIDYWNQINKNYLISVAKLAPGNIIYVMCGNDQYEISTDGTITIPGAKLMSDLVIWHQISTNNMWKIATIPIEVKFDLNKIVTTPIPVTTETIATADQIMLYDSAESAVKGFPVYMMKYDWGSNQPTMKFAYSYNEPREILFSLQCLQDFPAADASLGIFVDGILLKDFKQSTTNKTWATYGTALPSGAHTMTIEFGVKFPSGSFKNLIKVGDLKFEPIAITGDGTELSPYTTNDMNRVFAAGATANFLQTIALDNAVPNIYLTYNNITVSSVSVETQNSAATASIVNGKICVANIPARGITTLVVVSGANSFKVAIKNPGIDGAGNEGITGSGTKTNPYIISTAAHLVLLKDYNASYFVFGTQGLNLTLTGNFVPIGTELKPFVGGLDGNNATINGLNISATTNYAGLFGYVRGAEIKNITLQSPTVSGKSCVGGLVGYAVSNLTLENCSVLDATIRGTSEVGGLVGKIGGTSTATRCSFEGTVTATGNNAGGLWGITQAVSATSGGMTATNCTVGTEVGNTTVISGGAQNVGGLSGTGGDYISCTTYADVIGTGICVGGAVGGYQNDSKFTDTFMAGSASISGLHGNNYPYFGAFTGYGSWVNYTSNNSGLMLTIKYKSTQGVSKIDIFNCDGGYVQVGTAQTVGEYTVVQYKVKFVALNASFGLLSETMANGITGNYGGVVARFTMADGTLKYITTHDRTTTKISTNMTVNLDNLTSYVDNFATLTVDDNIGTQPRTTQTVDTTAVSIFGTVLASNANDFEHLQWLVNGGIDVTFAGAKYYNTRSIATLSIKLMADIDLTAERSSGAKTNLNRVGQVAGGAILNQFYGFGTSEMNPYRGSIFGNNHTLTVNMNFPGAYLMGIIAMSSEMNYQVVVSNLTVKGTIAGKYRVGVVGMTDAYYRSGTLKLDNVKNIATMTATDHLGGLVGVVHGTKIEVKNCTLEATIQVSGANKSAFVGSTGSWGTGGQGAKVSYTGTNKNYNLNMPAQGGGIPADGTNSEVNISRIARLHYGTGVNEVVEISLNDPKKTAFEVSSITVNATQYNFAPVVLDFSNAGTSTKDFYLFVLIGSLSKIYDGTPTFQITAANHLGTWSFSGATISTTSANAGVYNTFNITSLAFSGQAPTHVAGALTATIAKKDVTAAATDTNFVYSGADQFATTLATGFLPGEVSSDLTGGVTTFMHATYNANPHNAGNYVLTFALKNLNGNYNLIGTKEYQIVVSKAVLDVAMPAEYVVKKAFGSANPAWADIVVPGITPQGGTAEQVTIHFARGADEAVGTKLNDIVATSPNQNYSINLTSAKTFTIEKATPTIAFQATEKPYTGSAVVLENAIITGAAGFAAPTGAVTYQYFSDAQCTTPSTTHVERGIYYVKVLVAEDTNYVAASAVAKLTITKATPTVASFPTAGSIFVGQTLAASTLAGGSMAGVQGEAVQGTFQWKDSATVVSASGNYILIFTTTAPNYNETTEVSVNVEAVQLTVTFVDGNISKVRGINHNATFAAANFPTPGGKTNYTFVGWSLTASAQDLLAGDLVGVQANKTLTAMYTADVFAISYDLADGTAGTPNNPANYTVESANIVLSAPTKTGYTFVGWSGTGLSANTVAVTIASGSAGARSYVAHWQINQYTITFSATKGTISTTPAITSGTKVNYQTQITFTAVPSAGYRFLSWKINDGGSAVNAPYVLTVAAKDYAIEAMFTELTNIKYTVNHKTEDLAGGTFTLNSTETKSGTTGTSVAAVAKNINGFTAQATMPTGIIAGDGSLVLEVQYMRNSYGVTFGSAQAVQKKFEEVLTLSTPTKAGFAFGGWKCALDQQTYNGTYTMTAAATSFSEVWVLNAPSVAIGGYTAPVVYNPAGGIILTATGAHEAVGGAVLGYQWYKNGVAINGETRLALKMLTEVSDSATYKVVCTATKDSQTATAETALAVVINPAQIEVVATPYNAEYDGKAHGIILTTTPADALVEYEGIGGFSTANILYKDKQEAKAINYRVSKTNYVTLEGNATVTIRGRKITVTAIAQSHIYDGEVPAIVSTPAFWQATNVVEGEVLNLALTSTTLAKNVGDYPIDGFTATAATPNVLANYDVAFVSANLSIKKRDVTLKIKEKTFEFNNQFITLAVQDSDFIWSEDPNHQFLPQDHINLGLDYKEQKNAGRYPISAILQSMGTDGKDNKENNGNYNLVVTSAGYVITAKAVSITINPQQKVYDGSVAVPTSLDTDWAWTDAAHTPYADAVIGMILKTEAPITNAGTAPIVVDPTSTICNYRNYTFTFTAGTYTVAKRALTVSANSATSVWGEAQKAIVASVDHGQVVAGETAYSFAIQNASGQVVEVASADCGTYNIVGIADKNYDITFKPGAKYIITPKMVSIAEVRFDGEQNGAVRMNAIVGTKQLPKITTLPTGISYVLKEQKDGALVPFDGAISGISLVYAIFTAQPNYQIEETPAERSISFIIIKSTVTIQWNVAASYIYNGQAQGAEISASFVDEKGTTHILNMANGLLSFGAGVEFKNAGDYTAKLTVDKEYNTDTGSALTMPITIQKAAVDMSGILFQNKTVFYTNTLVTMAIEGSLSPFVSVSYQYPDGKPFNGITIASQARVVAVFVADSNHVLTAIAGGLLDRIEATLTIESNTAAESAFYALLELLPAEVTLESGAQIKEALKAYNSLAYKGDIIATEKAKLDTAISAYNAVALKANGELVAAQEVANRLNLGIAAAAAAGVAFAAFSLLKRKFF